MWTEFYFSQNEDKVNLLVDLLGDAEIISRVRCLNRNDSDSKKCFEVLVPRTELEDAQNIMVESDLF